MYTTFLEATTIKSKKKLHLACCTMPTVLEEMGVTMDEIDGIGHWASVTHCDVYVAKIPKSAVVALAGFYVGEAYHVPWAGVPVSGKLQTMLFPFVENALANLEAESWVNQGVVNFLELLQQLCPFFWWASGAIHEHFPDCSLFHCMKVFANPEARSFLDAVSGTELEAEAAIAATFSEANTQTAFMSLAARQKEFETTLWVQTAQLNILTKLSAAIGPTPERRGELASGSGLPSLPSSLCAHCGPHATSVRGNSNLTPPTPFDIILPSAAMFCDGVKRQAQYPTFTQASCGWHAIFGCISQPSLLWDCWGPRNLGNYPNACRIWSQYQFFTWRIEESIAHDGMALQTVCNLDAQCSSQTLPQLQQELQPKGWKGKMPATPNTTAEAGPRCAGNDPSRMGTSPPPGDA
ncbi:hypothetical protein EI94DRAFT_1706057 [Lactarius quietus]|nr:hypothetical protein EI94DRAFT_1706057 [Lactarius quietus]